MVPVIMKSGQHGILHDFISPEEARTVVRLDKEGVMKAEVFIFIKEDGILPRGMVSLRACNIEEVQEIS